MTAIPPAIPARPNASRIPHSTGTCTTSAPTASSGSSRARPRTNSSGNVTETATDATIHGAR